MTKKNFITLILSTIGGILFAVGMCMCLLSQWNAFSQGVVVAGIGMATLLAMAMVRRKMEGKPVLVKLSGKTVGTMLLSVAGALVLGIGMCMTMVWENLMVHGIVVGVIGIIMLMSVIPICKGIRE